MTKPQKQKQTQFLKTETEANILANPQAITKTQFLKTETEANPEAQTSNTTNTFTRQTYIYFHK